MVRRAHVLLLLIIAGCGRGRFEDTPTPTQPPEEGAPPVVAANDTYSLVNLDGEIFAWGNDYHGALGDGEEGWYVTVPQAVPIDATVKVVLAASSAVMVLDERGIVWTWGLNIGGIGPTEPGKVNATPTKVQAASPANAIFMVDYTAFAMLGSQTLGWGQNETGQLYGLPPADVVPPTPVDFGDDVLAYTGGSSYTTAIHADGRVTMWGRTGLDYEHDEDGLLPPTEIPDLEGATSIRARSHTLAVLDDGTVVGWGENEHGELGAGLPEDVRTTIAPIPGVSRIVDAHPGVGWSAALDEDGTVWCWGTAEHGECGRHGGLVETPTRVEGLPPIVQLSVGYYHALAVDAEGRVWAWGDNTYGQLGDGTTEGRTEPVEVEF